MFVANINLTTGVIRDFQTQEKAQPTPSVHLLRIFQCHNVETIILGSLIKVTQVPSYHA